MKDNKQINADPCQGWEKDTVPIWCDQNYTCGFYFIRPEQRLSQEGHKPTIAQTTVVSLSKNECGATN